MKKVSDTVSKILRESDVELEALNRGVLNMSAYAKKIQSQVEAECVKPVEIVSIVVALSRFLQSTGEKDSINVPVAIEDLTVKSPLCDICFERNTKNSEKLLQFQSTFVVKETEFCTITQGVSEITIIVASDRKEEVLTIFGTQAKACIEDLVAICVRFDASYLEVPNTLYSLMYTLAAKRINVLEIVSTYTELTCIVRKVDMAKSVAVLSELLGKKR